MSWWELVPDEESIRFYRRKDGWNKLKILREPKIRKNKFEQDVLRLSTDQGYFDISLGSPLAIALKKAAEKLNYKIAGCILEFEYNKENKQYGEIIVSKNGKILHKRSYQKIEEAQNNIEACIEAIKKYCESNSVYTKEAIKNILTSQGYNFSDDIIFHAIKKLEEKGVMKRIANEEEWLFR